MWSMYEELIAVIPSDMKINDIQQNRRWTMLSSDNNVGAAMKFNPLELDYSKYIGGNLQEVAGLITSWDFQEASLGLAAVNSYFNQRSKVESTPEFEVSSYTDAFDQLEAATKGKKIGMIGHFPYVDRFPEVRENIYVFELEPRPGDYPASASEFLLPEMDIVYITGSTIVNKTLPRLLALSEQAQTILVGASCPMSSLLFKYGVDVLAGTLFQQQMAELVLEWQATKSPLSKCGTPIMIHRKRMK